MNDMETGAPEGGPDSGEERRQHPRIARDEVLFVQAELRAEDGANRTTLRCHSADLSPGGLRLHLMDPLPVGTELELWIRIPGAARNYYLAGTVRWCRAGEHDAELGVAVHAAPSTDDAAWREFTHGVMA